MLGKVTIHSNVIVIVSKLYFDADSTPDLYSLYLEGNIS